MRRFLLNINPAVPERERPYSGEDKTIAESNGPVPPEDVLPMILQKSPEVV